MQSDAGESSPLSVRSLAELPELGERIIAVMQGLEEGWRNGSARNPIELNAAESIVGPALVQPYRTAQIRPTEELRQHRIAWIENAFEEVRRSLILRNHVFPSARPGEAEHHLVSRDGREIAVRTDQVYSLRFWGIWIEPGDDKRSALLAAFLLERALARLESNVGCVWKLCAGVTSRQIRPERVRMGGREKGMMFERLMADILNEDCHRARRAPLWEDLFEWTDLRVMYPGLPRRHGARVQVKLIGEEGFHDAEVAHRRNADTYVVLSPVRLAKYVEFCVEDGRSELFGSHFWECIGGEPTDTRELARCLLRVIERALTDSKKHALGPLTNVPEPVRQLIRAYVRDEAFETAKRMRDQLQNRPNYKPPWRKRI